MSMFGKSQRYLSVLQKVSDLEMRLDGLRTAVDRQSLTQAVADVPGASESDEDIAAEIEQRFGAVLQENIPTLVSEVRKQLEANWDLETVIGKEVFRLLENHLPELTAQELTEDEVAAVTEEVARRVRSDVEGLVETKLSELLPLLEKGPGTSPVDELRPRLDQVSDGMRRVWEEVARLKMNTRKISKRVDALGGDKKAPTGGSQQIPEHLMGRASIEDLVTERVEQVIEKKGSDSERRISQMENRLTKLSSALENNQNLFRPKTFTPPPRPKPKSAEEKASTMDQILNMTLRIRES